ncbi:glycosyltransferase [Pseudomonas sp. NPDC089534]|uniref:glycosyltransferase n=1 Tax=Pseudomonas sp. NPDC089534 TaxID=3364468 RepID=UPI0037F7A6AD
MFVELPKVAVLLAAYNGMQWIEEQVASILAQSDVDVTVFISIDPSADGTESWCAKLAANEPNVIVLPFAGKFGGAARNFFRLVRDVDFDGFDFVAFSDQDDIWHKNKLQRAVSQLERHCADAYSSNVTAFWLDGKTQLLDKAQPQVAWDFLFEAAGPGCTYVLSKRLAEPLKVLMLDRWAALQGVSLHDWFFYAYARSHGYKWYIDSVPSMDYRQHGGNQVGANTGVRALVSRYKTINNGWWFGQVRLIAQLLGREVDPFVKSWLSLGRLQLFRLSMSFWRCRRRVRDKMLFLFVCWILMLTGKKV